jgi:hypothetical protein
MTRPTDHQLVDRIARIWVALAEARENPIPPSRAAPVNAQQWAKQDRQAQCQPARPTGGIAPNVPVKHSSYRQDPAEIDKLLAEERRESVTRRAQCRRSSPSSKEEPPRFDPHCEAEHGKLVMHRP